MQGVSMLPVNSNGVGFGAYQRDSGQKASKSELWANICKLTCAIQMGGGLLMAALSTVFLFDYMLFTGALIGGLLFLIGAIGLLGALRKNKDFLNFHIVGAILAIILSFMFVGQVWREVEVDCALAELYIKSSSLEEITMKTAQDEMFDTIYNRMNEMEDMLTMVHEGFVDTLSAFDEEAEEENPELLQEKEFIQKKLEMLRQHADKILQDAINNPNITQDKVAKWTPEQRKTLTDKLDAAEKTLDRISEHHKGDPGKAITGEEYEDLLHALTKAYVTPSVPHQQEKVDTSGLAQAHKDLSKTKDALDKFTGAFATLEAFQESGQELSEEIKKRRDYWNNQYMDVLKRKQESHKNVHLEALESMPEHCIQEDKGIQYMGFAGLAVTISQLISIYFTLCLQFRIPVKME